MSVRDFVATLESAGFGDSIQNGRREIASWMDSKTTLRSLRLAAGLSQEQLAAAMDTSQSQIARIESRRQDVSLSTMERLAEALKIDIHSVVDAARG
jgi:predicted transcriptional regulator